MSEMTPPYGETNQPDDETLLERWRRCRGTPADDAAGDAIAERLRERGKELVEVRALLAIASDGWSAEAAKRHGEIDAATRRFANQLGDLVRRAEDDTLVRIQMTVEAELEACIKATCPHCAFGHPFGQASCGFPTDHVLRDGSTARCLSIALRARRPPFQ